MMRLGLLLATAGAALGVVIFQAAEEHAGLPFLPLMAEGGIFVTLLLMTMKQGQKNAEQISGLPSRTEMAAGQRRLEEAIQRGTDRATEVIANVQDNLIRHHDALSERVTRIEDHLYRDTP